MARASPAPSPPAWIDASISRHCGFPRARWPRTIPCSPSSGSNSIGRIEARKPSGPCVTSVAGTTAHSSARSAEGSLTSNFPCPGWYIVGLSALPGPDADGFEIQWDVDEDQLRGEVRGDGQIGLGGDLQGVPGTKVFVVDVDATVDDVEVAASPRSERVLQPARPQVRHERAGVLGEIQP